VTIFQNISKDEKITL